MPNLEIEIKFLISDIAATRNTIFQLGTKSSGRIFESNVIFDTPQKNLEKNNKLLRLRKDKTNRLTLKKRPPETDSKFKIHEELEVEVSDFEITRRILRQIGYQKTQLYEKYRETFNISEGIICIDELPFGNFLEIEGTRDMILSVVEKTGFNWKHRILHSYLKIFDLIRHNEKLSFTDVTFSNFKKSRIDIMNYLNDLKAG